MRDADRLDIFYDELKNIHMKKFPDLRFWQFICNFNHWLTYKKQIDGFYVEEDEMINLIREFSNTIMVYQI
jgi:hypothetical protein